MCVCVCVCVRGGGGERVRGGGGGGGYVRPSSLPDSDAVRAATMAASAPLEGLSLTPRADRDGKRRRVDEKMKVRKRDERDR